MTALPNLAALATPARIAAFQAWRKQPTTVAGLAIISGVLTAFGNGEIDWRHAAALLVVGLIMVVLDDNTSPSAMPQILIKTGK